MPFKLKYVTSRDDDEAAGTRESYAPRIGGALASARSQFHSEKLIHPRVIGVIVVDAATGAEVGRWYEDDLATSQPAAR